MFNVMIKACSFVLIMFSFSLSANTQTSLVNSLHQEIVNAETGIGAREAGSKKEQETAQYISEYFTKIGLSVTEQNFTFGWTIFSSKNIIADTNPKLAKTIILGAHYDSTAQKTGSLGATDNGAGIAAMLAIATEMSRKKNLPYNIRFIAFGAEEVGLQGSKYYVGEIEKQEAELKQIIGMINFDTIAGGDFVYVHSAHTTPYKCQSEKIEFNSDASLRDALLSASSKALGIEQQYVIHPEYAGYPEGVTGSWSDHAPFACAGIPIAYVESTNFTINGKEGYDGYSQSIHPELWDCYDEENKTACNRETEKKWGNIWHSQYDQLEKLNTIFPQRVQTQMENNVKVLVNLLSNFNSYY